VSDPGDCIFCRIVRGEIGRTIHEDDQVVAFDDLNPRAPVHVLIVPRTHLAGAADLTPDREPLAGRLLSVAAMLAARRGLAANGYRLVINCGAGAGQSVFHLHVHLLGGRAFAWPPG
jgi:histidine triad (HIT) family protein